jgi:hypothetical protein
MLFALLLAAHASPITVCPPLGQALPPAYAAWASPVPARRGLVPGRAARVTLVPLAASGIAVRRGYTDHPHLRGRRLRLDIAIAVPTRSRWTHGV